MRDSTALLSATGIGSRVRVTIVDDHQLFAEPLAMALRAEGHLVGHVDFPKTPAKHTDLTSNILRSRPDIVLLDLDLGKFGDGAQLIAPLVRSGVAVTVITATADEARWGECLARGARTVLSKGASLREIAFTIRRVSQGYSVVTPDEHQRLVGLWTEQRVSTGDNRARLGRLTTRESEILGHLTRGHTVREIAKSSVVSEATVRSQVKSILSKLDVSSQLRAVGLARDSGWQPPVE